jgi:hypothetical protein
MAAAAAPISVDQAKTADDGYLSMRLSRSRESWSVDPEDGLVLVVWALGISKLNRTASFLWQACDGFTPLSQIVHSAADLFAAPLEEITEDSLNFVRALKQVGLLYDRDEVSSYDELPLIRRAAKHQARTHESVSECSAH